MATTTTLRLVTSKTAKQPASSRRKRPIEDVTAWGRVYDALDEALTLNVSPPVRRRLLRCRMLVSIWAGRPHVQSAGGDADGARMST